MKGSENFKEMRMGMARVAGEWRGMVGIGNGDKCI